MDKNTLYYGDNLDILREKIPTESIDLVYLVFPYKGDEVRDEDELLREANDLVQAGEASWA